MSKAATDNVACIACGADVRSEALFCYNCGGAIAVHPGAAPDTKIADKKAAYDPSPSEPRRPDADVPTPAANDAVAKSAVKTERKPLTAAMLRRKRAYNRQPIEVVWEEPKTHSMLFVIASVVLTILVAIILGAVFYLK